MSEAMTWLTVGSVVHTYGSVVMARYLYGRTRASDIDDLAKVYETGTRNPDAWNSSVYGWVSHPYPGPVAEWKAERRQRVAVYALCYGAVWEVIPVWYAVRWLAKTVLEGGKPMLSQYEMRRLAEMNNKSIAAMKAELSVTRDETGE